jgi:hypothetical protein
MRLCGDLYRFSGLHPRPGVVEAPFCSPERWLSLWITLWTARKNWPVVPASVGSLSQPVSSHGLLAPCWNRRETVPHPLRRALWPDIRDPIATQCSHGIEARPAAHRRHLIASKAARLVQPRGSLDVDRRAVLVACLAALMLPLPGCGDRVAETNLVADTSSPTSLAQPRPPMPAPKIERPSPIPRGCGTPAHWRRGNWRGNGREWVWKIGHWQCRR